MSVREGTLILLVFYLFIYMEILFILGRIIFGGYFLVMGINHLFMKRMMLVEYSRSKGVPSPALAVVVTGIMLLLGGLGILLWRYVEISSWLLIIFLLGTVFKMHNFWAVDESQKMAEMTHFMKNVAFIGALLILLSIY